mmetsp:Transcript_66762/g.74794  ORF Transcript_66762/g.74794 Transcript_66762/m.74794 type:complete len:443 (-) Transcript_66762:2-1330(-)
MILSSSTKRCMFLVPLFSQSAHAFLLRSRGNIFCRNVVDKSVAIFSSSRRYHMVSSRTSSTSMPTMSTFKSKSNVILHRDKLETDKRRNAITAAGLDSLHVVLDFDHTLTSYLRQPHVQNDNDNNTSPQHDNGDADEINPQQCHNDEIYTSPPNHEDICPECHDVIQYGNYEPLERRHSFCSAIDVIYADQQEEKLTELSEWWIRFHEAVIAHQITEQEVRTAAQEAHIVLRPGAMELLAWLAAHHVQTTIVSAGVSTVIEEVLQQNNVQLPHNTQVIANVPVLFSTSNSGEEQGDDNERQIVAFEEPLIYSRNKAEVLIGMGFRDDPQKEENNKDDDDDVRNKHTKNVILAGNSIGDAACLLGIRHEHSLSFGFLHEEVEMEEGTQNPLPNGSSSSSSSTNNEKVQQFLENYDVIHCGYSSDFSYLLELLQEIKKVNKNKE